MPLQQVRAGTDNLAYLTHRSGDQRRVRQRGDADGDVNTFLEHVYRPVEQQKPDAYRRITLQVRVDRRCHVQFTEPYRRRHVDQAAGRGLLPTQRRLGVVDCRQYPPAVFQV